MFRKWLSGYYRRNKEKIELLIKILLGVALILFVMSMAFKNMSKEETNTNVDISQTTYKPKETIISGNDVKEEVYQEDSNIVKEFVNYCNNHKVQEAYNLLTDECKKVLYPTLEKFKQKYCDTYFAEKREYSLQSWVNNGTHTTYQMIITNDILSTGNYDESEKYQDYITIVDKNNEKKININSFVGTKEINKTTEKDGINITVKSVDAFIDHQEYILEIGNKTNNTIMLDDMRNPRDTIRVSTSDGFDYGVKSNSINSIKIRVAPGQTKTSQISFNKKYTSGGEAKEIIFKKAVKNYEEYVKDKQNYSDIVEIKVSL